MAVKASFYLVSTHRDTRRRAWLALRRSARGFLVLLLLVTAGHTLAALPGAGNALDFEGTDDYLDCGTDATLSGMTDYSLEAWVKPAVVDAHRVIVSNFGVHASSGGLQLAITDSPCRFVVTFRDATYADLSVTGTTVIGAAAWYHVAATLDWTGTATVVRLYVNGTQEGTQTFSGSQTSWDSISPLYIGTNIDGVPAGGESLVREFLGIIEEVRVWSAVVSAANLLSWMHRKVTSDHANYADLRGYWPLDDGSGGTAEDTSVNANDATLTNMAPVDDWVLSTAAIADASHYGTGTANLAETATVPAEFLWDDNAGSTAIFAALQVNERPDSEAGLLANRPAVYSGTWITNHDGGVQADFRFHFDLIEGISDESALRLYERAKAGDAWTEVADTTLDDEGNNGDGIGSITANDRGLAGFGQFMICSAAAANPFTPVGDLEVSVTENPDPVVAGIPIRYTVTIQNLGPNTASDVQSTATFDGRLLSTQYSIDGGTTWTAGHGPAALGEFAEGASAQVLFEGTVPEGLADTLTSQFQASTTSSEFVLGNNSVSVDTTSQSVAPTSSITTTTTIEEGDRTYDGHDLTVGDGVNPMTLTITGVHRFASLTIRDGVTVTHVACTTTSVGFMDLRIDGDLTVEVGAAIDVSARGFLGANRSGNTGTYGRTSGNVIDGGSRYGAGGTYGGDGGTGSDGVIGSLYGDLANPTEPGAGGGARNTTYYGGNGGGLVRLTVGGTCTHNGMIVADGGNAVGGDVGGGGAGGGVRIRAATFAGSGSIWANGGGGGTSSSGASGGGGGGRIAMLYTTKTFTGSVLAYGGRPRYGGRYGGAGTIFSRADAQTYGSLRLDNAFARGSSSDLTDTVLTDSSASWTAGALVGKYVNPDVTQASSFTITANTATSVTVSGGLSGVAVIGDDYLIYVPSTGLSTRNPLQIDAGTADAVGGVTSTALTDSAASWEPGALVGMRLNPNTEQNSTFSITGNTATTITVDGGLDAVATDGNAYALARPRLDEIAMAGGAYVGMQGFALEADTITIDEHAVLTHVAATLTYVPCLDVRATTLTIAPTGSIDVSTLGFLGAYMSGNTTTYGRTSGNVTTDGSQGGAGGTYGGWGGSGSSGVVGSVYGDMTNPTEPGAGGGAAGSSYRGGNGGGLVRLTVDGTCTHNGTILADGGNGGGGDIAGGGAGGGVYIRAGTLAGTGSISAVGGSGGTYSSGSSGGGGGGRIAIRYTAKTFSGSVRARGGRPRYGGWGGAGTIFTRAEAQTYGALRLDNAAARGTSADLSDTVLTDSSANWTAGALVGMVVNPDVAQASSFSITANTANTVTVSGGLSGIAAVGDSYVVYVPSTGVSTPTPQQIDAGASDAVGGVTATTLSDSTASWAPDALVGLQLNPNTNQNTTFPITGNTGTTITVSGGLDAVATSGDPYAVARPRFDEVLVTGGTYAGMKGFALNADSMTIEENAVLTHFAATLTSVPYLDVRATTLTITPAGSIDASNCGYLGAWRNENTNDYGRTTGNVTTGGSREGGGGSHGGLGGTGSSAVIGSAYDDLTSPAEPGAGGGSLNSSHLGGNGGGLVRLLTTGTFTLDGSVLADGGNGGSGDIAGGGAGGGVYIEAGILAGAGTVSADGGRGGTYSTSDSGGGGGGRIAIVYGTNSFAGTVTAQGGVRTASGGYGGAGTVFWKNSAQALGELVLDNGGQVPAEGSTPLPATPTSFLNLTVTGSARVTGDSLAQVVGALSLSDAWYTPDTRLVPLQVATLTLTDGATLTHPETTASQVHALVVTVTGDMNVDATSAVNADARGFLGGRQTGNASDYGRTTGNVTTGGSANGAGGSQGGLGGTGNAGVVGDTYGDLTDPSEPGAGGGANSDSDDGGNGGGLVRLTVGGTLTLNGTLSANGGSGRRIAGGGAGGGVCLDVGALAGQGCISADGGTAGLYSSYAGGGGGGGRVAIRYTSRTFTGIASARGGTRKNTGGYGGAGTVFWKSGTQSYGELVVDNAVARGESTDLTDTILTDSGADWTAGALVGLRLNPDTTQTTTFSISANDATTVTVSGGLTGVAALGDSYVIYRPTSDISTPNPFQVDQGTSDLPGGVAPTLLTDSTAAWSTNALVGLQLNPNTNQNATFPIIANTATTITVSGDMTPVAADGDAYAAARVQFDSVDLCGGSYTGLYGFSLTAETFDVREDAVLTHADATANSVPLLDLTVGTLTVSPAGSIVVDGRGFLGGYRTGNSTTYGLTSGNVTTNGSHHGAGGSYGGAGGNGYAGVVGAVYGDEANPVEPGAGGGANSSTYHGGDGGGLVRIKANTRFTLDGLLSANGTAGYRIAGGAAGGGVFLDVAQFAGSGTLCANGGAGGSYSTYATGGGGGGRIALVAPQNTYTGQTAVAGGTGRNAGGDGAEGTIYVAPVDSDGDNMPDWWEFTHFGNLSHDGTVDTDGDGLTDLQEYQNSTDPNDTDSDDDDFSDAVEVAAGTDPNSAGSKPCLHVNPARSDDSGDGLSWATAKKTLQAAIDAAPANWRVWVKEGTHYPTADSSGDTDPADPRTRTFTLKTGVWIYGGFDGTEARLSQRDWQADVTVLSGDIGTVGDDADNSYHVITGSSVANTRLDGFIITAGRATGTSPDDSGGGIYGSGMDSTNTVVNCTVVDNSATADGAGVFWSAASPVLLTSWISGNTAGGDGGAMACVAGAAPVLTNCIVSGNTAAANGGAVVCDASAPVLTNCTLGSNTAEGNGGGIYVRNGSSPTLSNCLFSGHPLHAVYEADATSDPVLNNGLFYGNSDGDVYDFDTISTKTGADEVNALAEASACVDVDTKFAMDVAGIAGMWTAAPSFSGGKTTLTNAAAGLTTNALAGVLINPDTNQCRQALVASNTATEIVVWGNVTDYADSGDAYRVVDYRLTSGSGAVDTGTAAGAPDTDIAGDSRPVDVRLHGAGGTGTEFDIGAYELQGIPPDPPSNPGATPAVTSMTWTWQDNSDDETAFKVWSDAGAGPPTTLRYTTAAGATSRQQTGLTANTQYAFQVASSNQYGDSARADTFAAYTLADTPHTPTVANATNTTLDVTIGGGDGNPATTEYAVEVSPDVGGATWIQVDGGVGASEVWETAAGWGTKTVTGLARGTTYSFRVKARNAVGTETALGPVGSRQTIDIPDPPSNPGASTAATAITWTWSDNSGNESGFKVWADPGSAAPTTLRTTTAAGATSWQQTGLDINSQHTFKVGATNVDGDSAQTTPYTTWTRAATPVAPTLDNPSYSSLDVTLGAGDDNPATTEYAIYINPAGPGGHWIQATGATGATEVWQTAATWNTLTVTGLTGATRYYLYSKARNGGGVQTSLGPSASLWTDCRVTFQAGPTGTLLGGSPQQQTVPHSGSCAAVTAVPDDGAELVDWTGTGGFVSTDNPVTVTNVTQDMTVTANFTSSALTVIVETDPLAVPEGGNATLRLKLSGAPVDTITLSVSRDSGDASLTVSGGSTVQLSPANWNAWQSVTIAAAEDNADVANGAAVFAVAKTAGTNPVAQRNVAVNEVDDDLTLTVTSGGNGSVTGGGIKDRDSVQFPISATPDAGYSFVNWTGPAAGKVEDADVASTTITTLVDASVTANFTATALTIAVEADPLAVPEGGTAALRFKLSDVPVDTMTLEVAWQSGDSDLTVSGVSSVGFLPENWDTWKSVTIAAAEDSDTAAGRAGFTIAKTAGTNPVTSRDVYADEIDDAVTLTVVADPVAGGVVTGGGLVDPDGGPFDITATANAGYHFTGWTTTAGTVAAPADTDTTIDGFTVDTTVTAGFASGGSPFVYDAVGGDPPGFRLEIGEGEFRVVDSSSGQVLGSQSVTITSSIVVNGLDGTDEWLTIDFGSGDFAGIDGITFNGGAGGEDGLVTTGGVFSSVTYTATAPTDGTIDFDGLIVAYSGLEPIVDASQGANRVFSIGIPGAQQIRLTDDANPGDGLSTIDSDGTGGFEAVTFATPGVSLTINAGDGDDVLAVLSVDSTFADGVTITVNGEAGNDTLTGPDATNAWSVTGNDAGVLSGSSPVPPVDFLAVETLRGGSGDDAFQFHTPGVRLGGAVYGGAGVDCLDHTGYGIAVVTVTGSDADGDLGTEPHSLGGGFYGINSYLAPTPPVLVPTLTEWGAIIVALALGLAATRRVRCNQPSQPG